MWEGFLFLDRRTREEEKKLNRINDTFIYNKMLECLLYGKQVETFAINNLYSNGINGAGFARRTIFLFCCLMNTYHTFR